MPSLLTAPLAIPRAAARLVGRVAEPPLALTARGLGLLRGTVKAVHGESARIPAESARIPAEPAHVPAEPSIVLDREAPEPDPTPTPAELFPATVADTTPPVEEPEHTPEVEPEVVWSTSTEEHGPGATEGGALDEPEVAKLRAEAEVLRAAADREPEA